MTVSVRNKVPARYGWSGDGKSAAEISEDIRQTRYRLDADVRDLRAKLAPSRLAPFAAVAGGIAVLTLLIRKIRGRRR